MQVCEMCLSRYSLPTCFDCCCCHHQGNLQDYNESKRDSAVGRGTELQAGRSRVRFPMAPWRCGPGVTQPVTDMTTRNISWGGGKGGLCLGLINIPPSCANCLDIWEPQPPGTLRVCTGLYRDFCNFTTIQITDKMYKWTPVCYKAIPKLPT